MIRFSTSPIPHVVKQVLIKSISRPRMIALLFMIAVDSRLQTVTT